VIQPQGHPESIASAPKHAVVKVAAIDGHRKTPIHSTAGILYH